jgi:hypothetical protein
MTSAFDCEQRECDICMTVFSGSLSNQVGKVWRSVSVDRFHLDQPMDQIQ